MSHAETKPPVWVGHITLETNRFEDSEAFMRELGMRSIVKRDGIAVLELRGGTHLVLRAKDEVTPQTAPFDLMYEDLEAIHEQLTVQGRQPSEITAGRVHRSFTVQDPSGHTITFNSSHVVGLV